MASSATVARETQVSEGIPVKGLPRGSALPRLLVQSSASGEKGASVLVRTAGSA